MVLLRIKDLAPDIARVVTAWVMGSWVMGSAMKLPLAEVGLCEGSGEVRSNSQSLKA
jgi:hypothetical protein